MRNLASRFEVTHSRSARPGGAERLPVLVVCPARGVRGKGGGYLLDRQNCSKHPGPLKDGGWLLRLLASLNSPIGLRRER